MTPVTGTPIARPEEGFINVKTALIAKLKGTTEITDMTSDRIAWGFMEQGASRPYAVCKQISAVLLMDLSSTGHDTDMYIQIDSVADTPIGAYYLSKEIKDALVGWGSTACYPIISRIALTNEFDGIEGPVPLGSDRFLHSVMQEYSVWHE